jgi:hypothetical protein
LPVDRGELSDGRHDRQGITGHSMGGHGALTIALRKPWPISLGQRLRSDRQPAHCPWGETALTGYLGSGPCELARIRRLRADRGWRALPDCWSIRATPIPSWPSSSRPFC